MNTDYDYVTDRIMDISIGGLNKLITTNFYYNFVLCPSKYSVQILNKEYKLSKDEYLTLMDDIILKIKSTNIDICKYNAKLNKTADKRIDLMSEILNGRLYS